MPVYNPAPNIPSVAELRSYSRKSTGGYFVKCDLCNGQGYMYESGYRRIGMTISFEPYASVAGCDKCEGLGAIWIPAKSSRTSNEIILRNMTIAMLIATVAIVVAWFLS